MLVLFDHKNHEFYHSKTYQALADMTGMTVRMVRTRIKAKVPIKGWSGGKSTPCILMSRRFKNNLVSKF